MIFKKKKPKQEKVNDLVPQGFIRTIVPKEYKNIHWEDPKDREVIYVG